MVTFWICGLLEWDSILAGRFLVQLIHVPEGGFRMDSKACLPNMI
jgi:hypothetical protein